MTQLCVAHVSDSHIGFRQYAAQSLTGRNAREQDFLAAFRNVVVDIQRWDPPLVIHSGDVFDAPVVSILSQKLFQQCLIDLTKRPDGSRRIVVVISGNHDQPADPREPAAIELCSFIPGVHIVTSNYEQIDLSDDVANLGVDPILQNVIVHALPHDQLKVVDMENVRPVLNRVNIFNFHGTVGGTDLYKRSKGREYSLPADVLARGWHYAAAGHWHKRGPIAVSSLTESTTPAWYAGSSENNGFGDTLGNDGSSGKGYLQVYIEPTIEPTVPKVVGVDLPIRPMYTLPSIDAKSKTMSELEKDLVTAASNPSLTSAVVRQFIDNLSRSDWALLDQDKIQKAAKHTLHYEAIPLYDLNNTNEVGINSITAYTNLHTAVDEAAKALYEQSDDLETVLQLSHQLLDEQLKQAPTSEE